MSSRFRRGAGDPPGRPGERGLGSTGDTERSGSSGIVLRVATTACNVSAGTWADRRTDGHEQHPGPGPAVGPVPLRCPSRLPLPDRVSRSGRKSGEPVPVGTFGGRHPRRRLL